MLMPGAPPSLSWQSDIQKCTRLWMDDYLCSEQCPFLCETPIGEHRWHAVGTGLAWHDIVWHARKHAMHRATCRSCGR